MKALLVETKKVLLQCILQEIELFNVIVTPTALNSNFLGEV